MKLDLTDSLPEIRKKLNFKNGFKSHANEQKNPACLSSWLCVLYI